jgi:hypothetical protein
MKKTSFLTGIALTAALATTAAAVAPPRAAAAQRGTDGGTATYWMSAETASGLSAQAGGGASPAGGRSLLGAFAGGGRAAPRADAFVHNLRLELGSPRRAPAPAADHFIPAGLNAGASLPLVSPEPARPDTRLYQGPGGGDGGASGRILVYWGCGEHARAGQPFEIDLSRMARGRMPPGMAGLAVRATAPPSAADSATFGEWPNQRSRTNIPAGGSLVGAHSIRGNYSPDINFNLASGQDFLAPIAIASNRRGPSGAVPVAWRQVPNATGYFLMAVGSRSDNTIVMWSSSEIQFSQMGAFDYLSPEEVVRLIAQRVVLQPATTQCTVPAEFTQGVQAASLMMTAFGPEANFATPRPASAARGWRPDWTVKLRTRSTYAGILGQDVAAMIRGETAGGPQQDQPRRPRRTGLGGLLGRVVGQ